MKDAAAFALLSRVTGRLHMVAFITPGHMEDHASAYPWERLYAAQDMHQDALAGAAPSQNAYRLALLYDQIYIAKSYNVTESNCQIPNLDKRCQTIMPHKLIVM
jgi:endo-1,4-beta-mannosidase